MSTLVFRSAMYTNQSDYLNWLNKVESKKWQIWKDQGLFDLIQLSKVGYAYSQNMLCDALHFWEGLTNTFQLSCGMITPTLFDVAVITSL